MLVFALFLVAQEAVQEPPMPVPVGGERVTKEVGRVPVFGDSDDGRERAEAMFDGDFRLLKGANVAAFDAYFVTQVDRPADVVATALPLFRKTFGGARRCIVFLDVSIRGAEEIVVDWSRVAFVDKGVARGALPGFARKITTSLAQRPSVAPAGAELREQVFAADVDVDVDTNDDQVADVCAFDGKDLVLDVPMRVGQREDRVRFSVRREGAAASEAQILALVRAPQVRPAPSGAPADFGFPVATVAAGSVGAAAGAGIGVLPAAVGAPNPVLSMLIIIPVMVGFCGGGSAAAAWFLVDQPAKTRALESAEMLLVNKSDQQRRANWERRRKELGITTPP